MDWARPKVRRCTIPRITFPVLLFKWSLLFVLISGAIKMGTTEWRNTRQSKGRDWSTKAIGSGGSSEISGAASRATLIPKERSRSRTQCTMLPKCTIMMYHHDETYVFLYPNKRWGMYSATEMFLHSLNLFCIQSLCSSERKFRQDYVDWVNKSEHSFNHRDKLNCQQMNTLR